MTTYEMDMGVDPIKEALPVDEAIADVNPDTEDDSVDFEEEEDDDEYLNEEDEEGDEE